jgi:hypothetical protein
MERKYKKAKSIAKKNFHKFNQNQIQLNEALEYIDTNGTLYHKLSLEMKVSDIEHKISSQIDQIRNECTQICASSQPDMDFEK